MFGPTQPTNIHFGPAGTFGQPTNMLFGQSAIGQPSQSRTTRTALPFGQPYFGPAGTFGQPSQSRTTRTALPFGQPSGSRTTDIHFGPAGTFGQSTNSMFGQSTIQKQSVTPFGQSTLGQPSQSRSTRTALPFGQPSGSRTTDIHFGPAGTFGQPSNSMFGQSTIQKQSVTPFGQSTLGQPSQSRSTRTALPFGQPFSQPSQSRSVHFGQSTNSMFGQSTIQKQSVTPFGQPTVCGNCGHSVDINVSTRVVYDVGYPARHNYDHMSGTEYLLRNDLSLTMDYCRKKHRDLQRKLQQK